MDEADREISIILRQVHENVFLDGNDRQELTGYIRRATFYQAAAQAPIRCRDQRTKAGMWMLAHERGYLRHGHIRINYSAPVIMFSGPGTIDWTRSHVREDIWERGGEILEPIAQLQDILSGPVDDVPLMELIR